VADAERIAAALRYQQELEAAQRPATLNPNLAAQGAAAREFMAPPTSVMDEKYPAFKKSKDQSEQLGMAIDVLSSVIPMAGPAVKGARAVGRFAGPELAQGLENYMVKTGGILPLDVYHGTPHRFPPTAKNPLGEFDTAKIGTGEGAQAYGHGLYLAENPNVAKGYQDALQTTDTLLNGKKVFPIDPNFSAASSISANGYDTALAMARRGATEQFLTPEGRAHSAALAKQIEALKGAKIKNAPSGNLYKVDLPDEQIAKMLDYDKPLTATPNGRAALDGLIPKLDKESVKLLKQDAGRLDGSGLVTWAQRVYGKDGASDYLQSHGIPGIRYLDQGSRAGGGTSNFVVFDPKHMNIIGRE